MEQGHPGDIACSDCLQTFAHDKAQEFDVALALGATFAPRRRSLAFFDTMSLRANGPWLSASGRPYKGVRMTLMGRQEPVPGRNTDNQVAPGGGDELLQSVRQGAPAG